MEAAAAAAAASAAAAAAAAVCACVCAPRRMTDLGGAGEAPLLILLARCMLILYTVFRGAPAYFAGEVYADIVYSFQRRPCLFC